MLTRKTIAVVGSREFKNFKQLDEVVRHYVAPEDWIVSGGAQGADSMAQRWRRENGGTILIHYPFWHVNEVFDRGAGFTRNAKIVESADKVLAFYRKGHFREGGTLNTANWAEKMGVDLEEFEEL
jgi:predicted Rossmann fold nucleotide-binding protein DprA/Smf involved in DNA uptake